MKKYLFCLVFLFGAFAAAAQTVTVNAATPNFEVNDLGQCVAISIPLTVKPADMAKLSFPDAHPDFIQNGGYSEDGFINGVELAYKKGSTKLGLTVDTKALYLQGTYALTVRYSLDENKTFLALSFNLVRSAATLANLNTVVITDEQFGVHSNDPIIIQETSGRHPVRDLRFNDPVFTGANGNGLLIMTGDSTSIAQSEQKNFTYVPNPKVLGDLPLGTTTGKLYFTSKMLTAPVPVVITVIRKYWTGWIIVLVLAGLMSGYLVRNFLATRKDNQSVAVAGYQLMEDIGEFLKTEKDSNNQNDLKDLAQQANDIVEKNLHPIVPNAAKALTALQSLQDKFDALRQTSRASRLAMERSLQDAYRAFNLPGLAPILVAYLKVPRDMVGPLVDAFKKNELVDAGTKLQDLYQTTDLKISAYKNYMAGVAAALSAAGNYPSQAVDTVYTISLKAATLLGLLQQTVFDKDNLPGIIFKLNDVQRSFEGLADEIGDNLNLEFIRKRGFKPDAGLSGQFAALIDMFRKMIADMENKPNALSYQTAALETDPALITGIDTAWANAIPPTKATAEAFRINQPVRQGGAPQPRPQVMGAAAALDLDITTPAAGSATAGLQLKQSKNRFLFLSFTQSLILAILISLGAYKTLEAGFVGKLGEMIGIYLFAFSLDISVGSITAFRSS